MVLRLPFQDTVWLDCLKELCRYSEKCLLFNDSTAAQNIILLCVVLYINSICLPFPQSLYLDVLHKGFSSLNSPDKQIMLLEDARRIAFSGYADCVRHKIQSTTQRIWTSLLQNSLFHSHKMTKQLSWLQNIFFF